ncbi:MAG TPA: thioesterase family protein [Azonexus sp.]|nr:thioesterase family protein [Azonexus sp.]
MTIQPTPSRRSPDEQVRLEAMLRDVFEHRLRFNEVLGLQVVSMAPEAPQLAFEMRPELIGHYLHGRLHGGVIAAALDTVGGFAVTVAIAEKFCGESAEQVGHRFGRIGTIDLRTDYLSQGIGKQFTATGRVTRLGGRIASVQMTLENESGLLIATGGGAYVVS